MAIFFGWIALATVSFVFSVPVGIWFIWGIFNALYTLIVWAQPKTKLTTCGILYLIAGMMTAVSTGLLLFADYNIFEVIFKI